MKISLITICTNRKKEKPEKLLTASSLPHATLKDTALVWRKRIEAASKRVAAEDLYCGRGFSEMRNLSATFGVPLSIISAGLGFINKSTRVPPYNLTITSGNTNSLSSIIDGKYDLSKWWNSINPPNYSNPISTHIKSKPKHFFILALSSSYWELIRTDLTSLPSEDAKRIRIIGLSPSLTSIKNSKLQGSIVPYDHHFDGPKSPIPGTRADFPQRACVHYIKEVLPQVGLNEDISYISGLMRDWPAPPVHKRKSLSDHEITSLMIDKLNKEYTSGAAMLRHLRDSLQVACEQGRCAKLYKVAQKEAKNA